MSKTSTACRACLVDNLTMYSVTNSPYEEVYEKLSNAKLCKGNLPETFCYICLNMLKKFKKFAALTQESNVMLEQWYKNEIDCKPKKHQQFKISTTSVEYITSNITYPEPSKEIKIKIEPDDAELLNQVQFVEFTNESDPYAAPEEIVDLNVDDSQVKDNDSFTDAEPKPGTPSDDEFEVPIVKLESRKRVKTEKTPKGARPIKIHRPAHTDGVSQVRPEGDTFACSDCDYKTVYEANIKRHIKIHSRLRQCDKCIYKSRNENAFKEHLRQHTKQKPNENCNYKTLVISNLKRHLLPHDEKTFMCDQCDFKATHKSILNLHLLAHSGEKSFHCDECDYKSPSLGAFKRHSMTHTGEKPFLCDRCDFRSATKGGLKGHLLKHTGEKPFACDICDYKASWKNSLKLHLRNHTGEKPFNCDKCDFKTKALSILKKHSMVHTGEKPFLCDKCDYKCTSISGLNRHILTHTGDKPFACDKCNYRTTQKNHLKLHFMTHTGEKPFACNKCDYKNSQKCNLTQHLKKHNHY